MAEAVALLGTRSSEAVAAVVTTTAAVVATPAAEVRAGWSASSSSSWSSSRSWPGYQAACHHWSGPRRRVRGGEWGRISQWEGLEIERKDASRIGLRRGTAGAGAPAAASAAGAAAAAGAPRWRRLRRDPREVPLRGLRHADTGLLRSCSCGRGRGRTGSLSEAAQRLRHQVLRRVPPENALPGWLLLSGDCLLFL